jgi:hypothetical protein
MFCIQFSGPFGFIKPWTAVRDDNTFSQQFLTPSIIQGIEKKLFPEFLDSSDYASSILRHRLSYSGISMQQEQTQPRAFTLNSKKSKQDKDSLLVSYNRTRAIINRGILVEPRLWLGFSTYEYALRALQQHICLCRNEDILLTSSPVIECSEEEFNTPFSGINAENFDGFEFISEYSSALLPEQSGNPQSFIAGYNRYRNAEMMRGSLYIIGKPIYQMSAV